MSTLQIVWFLLIAFLLVGYAILDGFDLGIGFWHLFARKDRERQSMVDSISPVWDGNEVWLIGTGAALFAAFPPVYATVFSALYLPLMLVLLGLIFRAVSIEFRGKATTPAGRRAWDVAFALGSTVPALLFGVALGNLLRGLPIDAQGNYTGGFFNLLNPYALLFGVLNIAMLATHGALYLVLRTEGELAARARQWVFTAWMVYLPLALIAIGASFFLSLRLPANYLAAPILWIFPIGALVTIALIPHWSRVKRRDGVAFTFSALSIALLLGSAAAAIFPNLVPSYDYSMPSLTIANSSSTPLTLTVMLIVMLFALPFVLGYTIWIYRIFGGKVKEGEFY